MRFCFYLSLFCFFLFLNLAVILGIYWKYFENQKRKASKSYVYKDRKTAVLDCRTEKIKAIKTTQLKGEEK